jgi:hypothetical protein
VNNPETPLTHPEWQHAAVQLLQGPVFEHEAERWRRVVQSRSEIDGYFRQIGLRLMIDSVEGYAYLEQVAEDELRELPRIMRRRQLSLGATVYGLFLRQELDRAIKDDPAVTRVRRSLKQIRELVTEFFPPTNNDTADRRLAVGHLSDLAELGFVHRVADSGEGNESEYELTRLLRAKFNPAAAEDLIHRIKHHLEKRHGNTDLAGTAPDAV